MAVGLAASLVLAAGGCSPSAGSVRSDRESGSTGGATGGATPAVGEDLIASANALSAADASGTVHSSAAARPTLVVQGTQSTTMTIRDEDASSFAPGHYELRTYCVGTGTLSARITIGDASDSVEQVPECTPQGTVGTVSVDVTTESSPAVVTITPARGAVAAVAYRVRQSPR